MKRHASLNRAYRLVWNETLNAYVAVSEHTKSRSKSSASKQILLATFLASLGFSSFNVIAGPEGGQITAGTGSISQSGNTTTITQTSQTLNANWQSFNVNSNETVNFVQPNSTALAVNRIFDTNGSKILGNINANGQVWLINPNGVFFGQGAQVNVGSLLAATLNPLNNDLNSNSTQVFGNGGTGSIIINQGNINAANGGYVALIANKVTNSGSIQANNGTVAFGAGSQVSVKFADNQLLSLNVDQSTLNNIADNQGMIQANGGQVLLSAGAKDSLLASVVNNTGKVEAKTVQHKDGKIILLAGMRAGTTNVDGTLDASAESGNGGFIETSAAHVKVTDSAKVTTHAENGKTGTWLIDPVDFTVAATGGDMTGAAVSNALALNNYQVMSTSGVNGTNGDININDAISWSTNNTLTLTAQRNININQSITATGATGKLALEYGQANVNAGNPATYNINNDAKINLQAGINFSTKLGSNGTTDNYQVITELGVAGSFTGTDLQGIDASLTNYFSIVGYALGADIDASVTSSWNNGEGFKPLGNFTNQYTRNFDGLGHTISNLSINRPSTDYVGLFGYTARTSTIKNVGLLGGNIVGKSYVGGLVGYSVGVEISNVYSNRNVSASTNSYVGGLVGANYSTIYDSYSTGNVSGGNGSHIGGLAGINFSTIYESYSTGNVSGIGSNLGGLVGRNYGSINNTYVTGRVSGGGNLGGLAGSNNGGISNSYSTGSVSGGTGSIVGGLVGWNIDGSIINAYAIGSVTGNATLAIGGLIGRNQASSINSFWNTQTSGLSTSAGGTGITTAQMQTLNTFTNSSWDIDDAGGTGKIWRIYEGQTSPLLRSFMTTLDLGTTTTSYNGINQTSSNPSGVNNSLLLGNAATGKNVGTFQTNYYSTQQGYDLLNGSLTIKPAILNLDGSRVYDGTNLFNANILTINGLQNGETLTLNGTGSVADKNVDTNKVLNVTNLELSNGTGLASNYTFTNGSHLVEVTAKSITVAATANNKVYDATTTATLASLGSTEVIAGDDLSFSNTTAEFANKNAGTDKTVTVTGITKSGADANNYSINTTTTTTADISQKAITVAATANNKVYDANATATLSSLGSSGVIAGDDVSFSNSTANFSDKNAGTNKTVTVTGITATGNDLSNYTLNNTSTTTTADVTAKAITVAASANNKVYDATTTATLASLGSADVIAGDDLSFSNTTANFDTKNAGTGKSVTVAGITATGADANNYSINTTTSTTADISQKDITIAATANNKVYDSTTTATLSSLGSSGVISGDTVNFSNVAANFDTKDVGTGKTVTVTGISATGADANNYSFNNTAATTADISPLALNGLTALATAQNKVYDGNANATATVYSNNVIAGDDVSFSYINALFDNKNVGSGKTVTVSGISTSGTDAGNYTLNNTSTTTTADITPKAITVAATANNKVYDATTTATLASLGSADVIAGDEVNFINSDANFADKNVGTGKTVTVNGITTTGADANNYSINTTASTTADITAKSITVAATANNKVYDGTTVATLSSLDSSEVIAGDVVNFTNTAANFDTKDKGTGKTVTVEGISATGSDANNYTFNNTATTTADITPLALRNLIALASAQNKVYDGTTTATANVYSNDIVLGDTVTFSYGAANFDTKNAGTGKTVTVTVIGTGGDDAGNYVLQNTTATTTADITAKVLNLSGSRMYDGTKTINANVLSMSGLVGSETLGLTGSGTVADKNVGNNKSITPVNYTLTNGTNGGLASNYTLVGGTKVANITPKVLTTTGYIHAENKTYDGSTTANVYAGYLGLSGLVGNERLNVKVASANFADKNAGNNKTVTVSYGLRNGWNGGLASNYTVVNSTTTANINKANLFYVAKPVSIRKPTLYSSGVPTLTGTLKGFVAGENQSNATTGTLNWTTNATRNSNVGNYNILGGGLSSQNYNLIQAPTNYGAFKVTR